MRLRGILGLVLLVLLTGCAPRGRIAPPEGKVILHKVREGESLEQIADDYYGDPGRSDIIREFNSLGEGEPEPGTVIQIPVRQDDLEVIIRRRKAMVPYNRGLLLAGRGEYVEAVGAFQDALAADPTFVDARYNLGITYHKMRSYAKALPHLEEVSRLRPGRAPYLFGLGNCLFHLGRYRRAADAFEEVLSLDPGHLKALYSLAVCYEKIGMKSEARRAWRKYLDLDNESEWAAEARRRLEKLGP